ncbi:Gfo/Idh/MocA family oxidoreductase [Streptomyces sp. NPDC005438]|uniref:Gfo/Idh/MocA family oxidoreductase n=1 Tax=Streptomyces sp. NPDC005438 TaxID=3156880 RepID=UPI0033A2640C
MNDRPLRVLVAGTSFGRRYVDALRLAPDEFRLVGLLAGGSAYSERYAKQIGVPLYTSLDAVDTEVDLAAVVLRSAVTGGPGGDIAAELLRRGVPVLQEHPVHTREISACARVARDRGVPYAVNTLYPDIAAVRRFLDATARLRESGDLRFWDAAANSQVLLPLLDVLGRATGGLRPWAFDVAEVGPDLARCASTPRPFRVVQAVIGGVPGVLRIQNQVQPDDPDNHAYLMHRVEVGTEDGVLSLAETHGPVLWNRRMHVPRDGDHRLRVDDPVVEVPVVEPVGAVDQASYREVFARQWPEAILSTLREVVAARTDTEARRRQVGWALEVATAWQALSAKLGVPELIAPMRQPRLSAGQLAGGGGPEGRPAAHS